MVIDRPGIEPFAPWPRIRSRELNGDQDPSQISLRSDRCGSAEPQRTIARTGVESDVAISDDCAGARERGIPSGGRRGDAESAV